LAPKQDCALELRAQQKGKIYYPEKAE